MDFIREAKGASPVPAGGATAACALGLAVALIHKAVMFELKGNRVEPELEKKKHSYLQRLHELHIDNQRQYSELSEKLSGC